MMISFIIAGIMNVALMFFVMFTLAFVTIGITIAFHTFVRKCLRFMREPDLAIK